MMAILLLFAVLLFTFVLFGGLAASLVDSSDFVILVGVIAVGWVLYQLFGSPSGSQPHTITFKPSQPEPPEEPKPIQYQEPDIYTDPKLAQSRMYHTSAEHGLDQQDVVREEIAKLQRALMKRAVDLDRSSEGSTVFGVMGDKSVPEMRTERALRNAKAAQKTLTLSRPWKGGMY